MPAKLRKYTVYHILPTETFKGKVGVSSAFQRRCRQNRELYGLDISIEVLEKFVGTVDKASRKECEWQNKLGYESDRTSYSQTLKTSGFVNSTREQQSERGKVAAKVSDLGHMSKEDREKHKVGFEHNSWYNGSEKHKEDAKRGANIAAKNKSLGMQTKITCPYCGKEGQTAIMGRWHFDNCKSRSVSV